MPSEHAETIDVHRFRNRDPEAFEAVVRAYYDRVYRLALRLLCNAADAEDVVQEAFLKVHRSAPRFRGDSSLSTWVYRIAHNVCLDELRRRKRRPLLQGRCDGAERETVQEPEDEGPGPEEAAFAAEERLRLRRALESLPLEFRSVLILREVEDLSYDQIAAVLKCPVGTVRSRLARARRMLAERLQRSDDHELQERFPSAASLR